MRSSMILHLGHLTGSEIEVIEECKFVRMAAPMIDSITIVPKRLTVVIEFEDWQRDVNVAEMRVAVI